MDGREKWFPCEEGDWVVLDNGLWAEVILQSPEAVHLREEGGAVSHFTTSAFLDQNPKNVSHTFRATVEFGIDYAHQSDAPDTIPGIMQTYVDRRLREMFGDDNIIATHVNLFRAGASSLDYEIEADVGPGMGHAYETVEHALTRFAVECCSKKQLDHPVCPIDRSQGLRNRHSPDLDPFIAGNRPDDKSIQVFGSNADMPDFGSLSELSLQPDLHT